MKRVTIASLSEMKTFAESVLKNLKPQKKTATVFGLRGDLGAGKTAFVKAIAETLGVKEHITSPTFVIQKIYNLPTRHAGGQPTTNEGFKKLVHIDAYRLQSGDELKKIEWEETVADPTGLIFVEWPENVKGIMPEGAYHIDFEHVDEHTRSASVMKTPFTLCVIHKPPNILLGMKKRGFGAGKWNGFGGKVGENETLEQATLREIKEEVGIVPHKIEKVGILEFAFENDTKGFEMHIFCGNEFEGEPTETEEMKPQWFHVDNIPFSEMWPDDEYWIPLFLSGKLFRARFLFDRPSDTEYSVKIIEHTISEVEKL
ncbi:MAG: tRNA (adenosine(37)-N6)-threonylcarbamoyltransferase complex ATPase subunit type 1 TsaE [Patescibacteria group bacterium]